MDTGGEFLLPTWDGSALAPPPPAAELSKSRWESTLKWFATSPLLVILYLVFYTLPAFGLKLGVFMSGAIALMVDGTAFTRWRYSRWPGRYPSGPIRGRAVAWNALAADSEVLWTYLNGCA